MTLQEILKADAKREARSGLLRRSSRKPISKERLCLSSQELIAWAKKQGEHPSKTAKEIMQLNTTFAKAALKKETWPSYYTTSVI